MLAAASGEGPYGVRACCEAGGDSAAKRAPPGPSPRDEWGPGRAATGKSDCVGRCRRIRSRPAGTPGILTPRMRFEGLVFLKMVNSSSGPEIPHSGPSRPARACTGGRARPLLRRPVGRNLRKTADSGLTARRPLGQAHYPCRGTARRLRQQVPQTDAQCGRSVRGRSYR